MFEAVKGQDIAVKMLSRELEGGALPQALLFSGPEGSGKFLAALELARLVNCPEGGAAECACTSCREISNLSSRNVYFICKSNLRNSFELWRAHGVGEPNLGYFLRDARRLLLGISDEERYRRDAERVEDLLRDPRSALERAGKILDSAFAILDAQKSPVISINRVRELQRFLWLKGAPLRRKVVIIDGAERMNEEASNSFLKISEEPPPDSCIVITAVQKALLRETIRSRFRAYRFVALSRVARNEVLRERFGPGAVETKEGSLDDGAGMHEYLERLGAEGTGLRGLLGVVDDILERGHGVRFFSFVIERLSAAARALGASRADGASRATGASGIEGLSEIEGVMKAAAFQREAVLRRNVNPELALTDFLLNNHRFVVKWGEKTGREQGG